jgi:hypothetical protein
MKPSLYLETTIPSYLAARTSGSIIIAGRQAVTHEFWEGERHKYNLFVSDYVIGECMRGDVTVAKKRLSFIEGIESLKDTPDIDPLADAYMRLLSIPKSKRIDALHLAMCSIHGIDILLSWNCTHLGAESMQIAQKHNDAHGLHTPKMITPDALFEKYSEVDFDG